MIFVTVGNAKQRFVRLLEAVDAARGAGALGDADVFMQTGHNEFEPRHGSARPFLSMDEFAARISEAELVVSHGGAGTLLHVLQTGRVPVVMPRRRKWGEHVDDHQLELVRELAGQGRVVAAFEADDLAQAIREARSRNEEAVPPPAARMIELVDGTLSRLIERAGESY